MKLSTAIRMYGKYPQKKGGTYHHIAKLLKELKEFREAFNRAKKRRRFIARNIKYGPTHGAISIGYEHCFELFERKDGGDDR